MLKAYKIKKKKLRICLKDTFHYFLSPNHEFFLLLGKHWSLSSETDLGGQVLSCDTSLLISQGGPKVVWLPLQGVVSALRWFFVPSPPPSNELTLLFIWDTSKASLPLGHCGEWLSWYHFFSNEGDTSTSWGANYSLSCIVLPVYMAPFLAFRERQLFLRHCVSSLIIKPGISPLVLVLTGRLTFCPVKSHWHSRYQEVRQHSLAM